MDTTSPPLATGPVHTPPGPDIEKPRGILKNAPLHHSPPASPLHQQSNSNSDNNHQGEPHVHVRATDPAHVQLDMSDKELTIHNTQINAGPRRSSSSAATRPAHRAGSQTPSHSGDQEESSQRLKWDEANLYLTEQERTSTMKITEPKTPYAKHYDPAEDPSDDEGGLNPESSTAIPGLSIGEPEEPIPERPARSTSPAHVVGSDSSAAPAQSEDATPLRPRGAKRRSGSRVHVDDTGSGHDEEDLAHMSEEEKVKHRQFEEKRKKHYEMRNVADLLAHPENLMDDDDDEDAGAAPPMPLNGRAT